ncbi:MULTISPECIES: bifunctional riboflavin kinase/FAD synthetase [Basfia]|uniref:Riboflavin biosynthesis protein n=2 Tax=Basfia TaxID=697331 RepID=Q65RQ1_MANSM|nr:MULTISPECIES: bifunctional riboflavin kinase/FAD synthetase [Basfia]AAU38359.1 RibF protein [[Mannheimia] succiniciproducens MBEL55E]QIM68984.1 riboflavin biosynthesis protein RibF [Basfia succiniciproducens]SCY22372.1 FMN adenylyltransferase /riboflavin kinase [Basfia succiniciproducens]SEQ57183.1 FMN adenylyltransferase /riboflavin kinase [Basfia succiniciproducens]
MQLIRGLHNLRRDFAGCALTIGNFDGVHLGHQAILQHLREKANQLKLPMVVMLFEPQPREYFVSADAKQQAPARLMRLRDKLHYLQQQGVDYVICVKFDRTFAKQDPNLFIETYLVNRLHVKFLSIGDDFRFGANRRGDFSLLESAGKKYGFSVEDNRTFSLDKLRISSTAIRHALAHDDLKKAEELLGRAYSIFGKVVHGQKLGRTIGFPTANIRLQRQVNPLQGVYAVRIQCPCGRAFQGVANIGQRPTVNGVEQRLEVHLFDFDENLYGQNIAVTFCHKIRNEMKFPSLNALKQQIARDVLVAQQYFRQNS